jgi:hypothetical protein
MHGSFPVFEVINAGNYQGFEGVVQSIHLSTDLTTVKMIIENLDNSVTLFCFDTRSVVSN